MVSGLAFKAIKEGKVKCVILAAGMGRRQGPATDSTLNQFAVAKPLLPVAGRKIIDFSIAAARHIGLPEVSVSAGKHWKKFERMLLSPERIGAERGKGITVRIHGGERPRDTLGDALAPLKKLRKGETVIVLSGDIVTNIDLNLVLEAHLESNAAATVVALPVPWESQDWKERGFPLIMTEKAPAMSGERWEFEARLKAYFDGLEGKSVRVSAFPEKTQRESCPTNLSITSIYILSSDLLLDLMPALTPMEHSEPFSDFGFHVFPLLAKQFDGLPMGTLRGVADKISKDEYPFYAYVPPQTGINGNQMFWHDIWDPMALWKMNMTALGGLAEQWAGPEGRYNAVDWGFIGNSSYLSPDVQIGNIPERFHFQRGISIIGSNVSLSEGVRIGHSFIDDYTNLQPDTEVINSVISLGFSRPTSYIGKTRLVNCLVLGEGIPPYYADIRMLRSSLVFNLPYFEGFGIVPLQSKRQQTE